MSDIKMCDGCGNIFPTTVPGWSQHTQTVIDPQHDHSPTRPTLTLHACPDCTGKPKVVSPRLPDASLAIMAARAEVDEAEEVGFRAGQGYTGEYGGPPSRPGPGVIPGEPRYTE